MATAENILKKKLWSKKEMDANLPKEESNMLWEQVRKRLDGYLQEYADIPKGEHTHTDSYIFPAAAIYLTLKDAIGAKRAFSILEAASIANIEAIRRKLVGLLRIPGAKDIFIKVWYIRKSAKN